MSGRLRADKKAQCRIPVIPSEVEESCGESFNLIQLGSFDSAQDDGS
jgi:hypothetical protein